MNMCVKNALDERAQRKLMKVHNAKRWVCTTQIDECVFLDTMSMLIFEWMSVHFDKAIFCSADENLKNESLSGVDSYISPALA